MHPELDHYRQAFEHLHAEAAALLEGLPPEALNWRPLAGDESTNSLAVTVHHMAGSERFWVGEVAGGRPAHRDRDAEFRATAGSAAALAALLEQANALNGEALAGLSASQLDETVATRSPLGERTVTRRWAVQHALTHIAVHLGHMQLTRQLWQARGS